MRRANGARVTTGTGLACAGLAVAVLIPLRPGPAARVGGLVEAGRLGGAASTGGRGRTRADSLGGQYPAAVAVTPAVAAVVTSVWCGWLLGGFVLALPFGLAGLVGSMLVRRAVASRTATRDTGDLLRAVRVIAGELSSGAGPPAALGAAAGLGGSHAGIFAEAAAAAGRGEEVSTVLLAGEPAVRNLGHVWRIGESSGAALAVVLERVAADLGAELDQRRAVTVALAGPRSSATVVAGLPMLGLGLGVAMGADPFTFLCQTPAGRLVCAAGIVLDVIGIAWMARILRRAQAS